MSGIKKTEISSLKTNFSKLKTIANFLDISLDEVTNVCLYPGVYQYWLPIAKIIDEFPDWDLDSGEGSEKLYGLKQKYIEKIHAANKKIQEITTMEGKFNKIYSHKRFNTDLEHYKAFIDSAESQLKEEKPQPPKPIKERVEKVVPLEVKETTQSEAPLVPIKESTMRIYLQLLLKTGIFVLFFITPILLFVIISEIFFLLELPSNPAIPTRVIFSFNYCYDFVRYCFWVDINTSHRTVSR